jgi:hypothetical protein
LQLKNMGKSKALETIVGIAKTEVFCGETTFEGDNGYPTYGVYALPINFFSGAALGGAVAGPDGVFAGMMGGMLYRVFVSVFGSYFGTKGRIACE